MSESSISRSWRRCLHAYPQVSIKPSLLVSTAVYRRMHAAQFGARRNPRKRPPFRKERRPKVFSNLVVGYFRFAKTTAPAMVRTALSSSEKSTERLISISPLRHNCPNTMRKQASDAVNGFIAGLLCRATVPSSTTGPFFVSNPALPELAAGAWAFRLSDPTEIGRIVLDCFREHLLSQKPDLKTLEGPPFEAPPYE